MVVKDRIGHTRYVVFSVEPGCFDRKDIIRALNRVASQHGFKQSPRLILFEAGKGIVKCTNKELTEVKALLPGIKEVSGTPVETRTVVVSGTLRKAKEYLR